MYNLLVKHFLFPLYFGLKRDRRVHYLKKLETSQWRDIDMIRKEQLFKLQQLFNHAYQNVPFYKDNFDQYNILPGHINSFKEIESLPFLTKKDIQVHLEILKAQNYKKEDILLDASGGSTGAPTNFYADLKNRYRKYACQYRHDRWSGWDIGKKMAVIWGADHEADRYKALRERILTKYLFRSYMLNAFDITDDFIKGYINVLNREKPAAILAYTNAMYLVANYIRDNGLKVYSPKGIIVSAETLTEQKRTLIQSVFKCKVLNRYGSREVGLIACECEKQEGLHINADDIHVEIIKNGKPAKPGEIGEIVVTDLHNFAMPIIRYKTGDAGSLSNKMCSCGRGFPLIKEVTGRVSDFFITKEGKMIHGEYFTHLFYGLKEIKRFQVIQEHLDEITVKLSLYREIPTGQLNHIIESTKQIMGDVTVSLIVVDDIPLPPSGKFIFTISNISNTLME